MNSNIRSFLRQATEIVSSRGELNEQTLQAIQQAALDCHVSVDEQARFWESCRERFPAAAQKLTRYESHFVRFLENELRALPDPLLPLPAEQTLISWGQDKYQIGPLRVKWLVADACRRLNITRVSPSDTERQIAQILRERLAGQTFLDDDQARELGQVAEKWGLERRHWEQLLEDTLTTNWRWRQQRLRQSRIIMGGVGLAVLLIASSWTLRAGWLARVQERAGLAVRDSATSSPTAVEPEPSTSRSDWDGSPRRKHQLENFPELLESVQRWVRTNDGDAPEAFQAVVTEMLKGDPANFLTRLRLVDELLNLDSVTQSGWLTPQFIAPLWTPSTIPEFETAGDSREFLWHWLAYLAARDIDRQDTTAARQLLPASLRKAVEDIEPDEENSRLKSGVSARENSASESLELWTDERHALLASECRREIRRGWWERLLKLAREQQPVAAQNLARFLDSPHSAELTESEWHFLHQLFMDWGRDEPSSIEPLADSVAKAWDRAQSTQQARWLTFIHQNPEHALTRALTPKLNDLRTASQVATNRQLMAKLRGEVAAEQVERRRLLEHQHALCQSQEELLLSPALHEWETPAEAAWGALAVANQVNQSWRLAVASQNDSEALNDVISAEPLADVLTSFDQRRRLASDRPDSARDWEALFERFSGEDKELASSRLAALQRLQTEAAKRTDLTPPQARALVSYLLRSTHRPERLALERSVIHCLHCPQFWLALHDQWPQATCSLAERESLLRIITAEPDRADSLAPSQRFLSQAHQLLQNNSGQYSTLPPTDWERWLIDWTHLQEQRLELFAIHSRWPIEPLNAPEPFNSELISPSAEPWFRLWRIAARMPNQRRSAAVAVELAKQSVLAAKENPWRDLLIVERTTSQVYGLELTLRKISGPVASQTDAKAHDDRVEPPVVAAPASYAEVLLEHELSLLRLVSDWRKKISQESDREEWPVLAFDSQHAYPGNDQSTPSISLESAAPISVFDYWGAACELSQRQDRTPEIARQRLEYFARAYHWGDENLRRRLLDWKLVPGWGTAIADLMVVSQSKTADVSAILSPTDRLPPALSEEDATAALGLIQAVRRHEWETAKDLLQKFSGTRGELPRGLSARRLARAIERRHISPTLLAQIVGFEIETAGIANFTPSTFRQSFIERSWSAGAESEVPKAAGPWPVPWSKYGVDPLRTIPRGSHWDYPVSWR